MSSNGSYNDLIRTVAGEHVFALKIRPGTLPIAGMPNMQPSGTSGRL
jgi:hypothetical protein